MHKTINKELYNEILNSNKNYMLFYFKKTDIIITEDNIEYIKDVESLKSDNKSILNNLKIGDEYTPLDFIMVSSDNIDDIKTLENDTNFSSWL